MRIVLATGPTFAVALAMGLLALPANTQSFAPLDTQQVPPISVQELPPFPIQGLAPPPVQGPLPGVLREGTLNPRLPGDVKQLKFSPDGSYILAQDDSSIFILTRQPLAVRFRIAAADADAAQFTPDSSEVVFLTYGAHVSVQRWNIANASSAGRHDLDVSDCAETRLSPDGNTVACFSRQTEKPGFGKLPGIDLTLVDVATAKTILERKNFLSGDYVYSPLISDMAVLLQKLADAGISSGLSMIPAAFSPDSHYFLAGFENQIIAYDLTTRMPIPLQGSFGHMVGIEFNFVSPNQVLVLNPGEGQEGCALLEFPGGLVTRTLPLVGQSVSAATRGNYFIVRPMKDAPVGILNWNSLQLMAALRQDVSVDVYDKYMVTQTLDGRITLFDFPEMKLQAAVRLPFDPAEPMQAGAVSPDLEWLALSLRTRSAVWNLSASAGPYLLQTFHSGHFAADSFYADAPPLLNTPRSVDRVDLSDGKVMPAYPIDEPTRRFNERGRFLLSMTEALTPKGEEEFTLHVANTDDAHALWTRTFAKETPAHIEITPDQNRMVFRWNLNQKEAVQEIKKDKALKSRYDAMQDRSVASLFEVVDADTGKSAGSVLAESPGWPRPADAEPFAPAVDLSAGGNLAMTQQSENAIKIVGGFPDAKPKPSPADKFVPPEAFAAGDFLFVTGNGLTQVYSISSGMLKASVAGTAVVASTSAGLFATVVRKIDEKTNQNESALQFYSLSTQPAARLDFASPIAMVRFSSDGSRLLVLSQYQQFFIFDTSSLTHSSTTIAAK